MGYYTDYYLTITNLNGEKIDSILKSAIFEQLNETIDETFDESGWIYSKWYEFEKDMTEFSKMYPDLVFHLDGSGEEVDDRWKAVFWNGKSLLRKYEVIEPKLMLEMLQNECQEPFKNYNVVSISKEDIFAYARSDKNMNEEEARAFVNSFTDEEMKEIADILADIVFDTIAFDKDLSEAIEETLSNRVAMEKE